MKMNPWLRVFACGATVGVGSLLGVPSWGADDDPPVASGSASTAKDDAKAPPSEFALTKELLGHLSDEHMKSLGEMLEKDWKDRPEWGEMAVAILKDDFMRPGAGWWKPSAKRFDWNWLSERFDANKDGKIEREEFPKDIAKADQLFARLDRDGDEQLAPADFEDSDPMKSQMSNRLFDKFDFDSNGRVTQQEISEFFRRADKDKSEFLTPDDWWLAIDPPAKRRTSGDADAPAIGPSTPTAALRMLMRGELGWLTTGPQLGDLAPNFTLPKHDGSGDIKLSDSFGKRPVVLVFGSFT
ncbi:MAG: hypothetical protein IAG10_12535 [Planctomycetaceae bacterium]|nr:hypothetical protein [Planctomycetaceae bacterium]